MASMTPFSFEGSAVVITGAASGIGAACAVAFAERGADVVVSDIDEGGAAFVAEKVGWLGRRATVIRCDAGSRDEVVDLVERSIAWQGHVDLFMSNAGLGFGGEPHQIADADWDRAWRVNLMSQVWAVQAVVPHMLERGSGWLVHTASASGLLGNPATSPYVVTKHGVVGLAESLAVAYRDRGIGVTVVCPLFVKTNIYRTSIPPEAAADVAERLERGHDLIQSIGIPAEDVASSVVTAVEGGQLYCFPNPELVDIVRRKVEDPDRWLAGITKLWREHPGMLDPGR
jgi:NAD(P)-dependent dehydrogenase (short-subunit alcohol dehydrogenase family)